MGLKISELNYELGPENICREPAEIRLGRRDLGRLFVVDRTTKSFYDSTMLDFPRWLNKGDVLVLNNSKRIPGIVLARFENGAQAELRFAEWLSTHEAYARIYPGHFAEPGRTLILRGGGRFFIRESGVPPYGLCKLESQEPISDILRSEGVPITSFFSSGYWKLENYNNVFANEEGYFESPMAGLHFTHDLLHNIASKGININFVTLHAVGSWLPFLEEEVDEHHAQTEPYRIEKDTADAINQARAEGNRVVAVGTTVVRALEHATDDHGQIIAGEGRTSLFIKPGYKFRVIDCFFTNFHPARSSLMVLDAAFCSKNLLLEAYEEAKNRRYFFHEFGDAVFYV